MVINGHAVGRRKILTVILLLQGIPGPQGVKGENGTKGEKGDDGLKVRTKDLTVSFTLSVSLSVSVSVSVSPLSLPPSLSLSFLSALKLAASVTTAIFVSRELPVQLVQRVSMEQPAGGDRLGKWSVPAVVPHACLHARHFFGILFAVLFVMRNCSQL